MSSFWPKEREREKAGQEVNAGHLPLGA